MEQEQNIKGQEQESSCIVEAKNVRKYFGSNHVLEDINFCVRKGENVVVMGKSGTGKSVLIKCLVNLIEADSGNLNVFGKDILSADDKQIDEIRDRTGFLFQGGALYDSMTVKENLEFQLIRRHKKMSQQEADEQVAEALANVGLEDTGAKMPSELSGGQRKRISLARTIILKPDLILYDEPTTGLDPITSQEISELILEIQEKYKTTSVIITHDIKCAGITADRILLLDKGKFVAEGTFEELKNSEDELASSFFH